MKKNSKNYKKNDKKFESEEKLEFKENSNGFEREIESIRLNKFISHNTKYSRREADVLIAEGKVSVDGKIVSKAGTVIEDDQRVSVNNIAVKKMENMLTVVLYSKPRAELVTKKDDRGRKTIFHALPTRFRHFLPIGRLDYASEGLLLLTDNTKVATALMESRLERVYNLKVNGLITEEIESAMQNGLEIRNSSAGAHSQTKILNLDIEPFLNYKVLKNQSNFSRIRVAISEGQNRELRRFFAHFNLEVLDLKRVSFGGIELNNLPSGKWRFLTKREYDDLKLFLKELKKEKRLSKLKVEDTQNIKEIE